MSASASGRKRTLQQVCNRPAAVGPLEINTTVFFLMTILDAASKRTLKREFDQLYSVLDYSMHELPAGVLWNPDAATPAQCLELMGDLNRFVVVSEQLSIATHAFVEACRWHLEHYPHYLSRRRHFVDYAGYISDRGGPLRVPFLDGRAKEPR